MMIATLLECHTQKKKQEVEEKHLKKIKKGIKIMSFKEWDNDHWKVKQYENRYYINAPGTTYVFNEHDFMELQRRLNSIDIFAKADWFIMTIVLSAEKLESN